MAWSLSAMQTLIGIYGSLDFNNTGRMFAFNALTNWRTGSEAMTFTSCNICVFCGCGNVNSRRWFENGKACSQLYLWCKLSLDAAFVFHFRCFCSNQGCFMKPTGFSFPVLAPVCFLATAHYLHPVLGHLKMAAWLFWLCMWTTNCLLVLFVWVRCVLADRRKCGLQTV